MTTSERARLPSARLKAGIAMLAPGLIGLTLAVLTPAAALAQDKNPSDPAVGQSQGAPLSAQDNTTVDSVIVTARKREETIRDVPSTISATTAAQLTAVGPVTGTGDLLRVAPGVRFNDLQAPNLSEVSIRGSGTQRATGADSSVGLFFNGAYVGSSTLGGRNFKNIDFFDIERVEVLKGPQGALYGRNSEYGTINLVSAKPKFANSGYVDETYISGLDQNRIIGVVNQDLGGGFALRLGAEDYAQDGGFIYNPTQNNYYDRTEGYITRGQLRYKHGPLDVNLMLDAQSLRLPVFATSYVIKPNTIAVLPLGYTSDPYSLPSNASLSTFQRVQRGMLTIDYDFGWSQLTSTTLVSHSTSRQQYGDVSLAQEGIFQSLGEVGVYPLAQTTTLTKDNTLYEDLHLSGNALNGRLNWLVGAEVLDQHDSNERTTATSPCTLTARSGICGGTPAVHTCYLLNPTSLPCPATYGAFGVNVFTPLNYLSESGYGSLKYDIGAGFSLSGELRYTSDSKSGANFPYLLYTTTVSGAISNYDFAADRTNYTVTLSYKLPWEGRQLLYVKTGTGYRAGGINAGVLTAVAPLPFRPSYTNEDTASYEAGLKGNLTRNIYFTIAGYMSRTTDAIALVSDGCTTTNACAKAGTAFNLNAGVVEAHGVEMSLDNRFQLWGGRGSIGLQAANQEATYTSLAGAFAGLPILGSAVAQIPDWTGSVSFDYARQITASVDGFFHIVWQGQSGGIQDTVTTATPLNKLENYGLTNLRMGVNWHKIQLAFFVQNLTDEHIALLKLQQTGVPLYNRYSQPRTVGVNAVYKW